MATPKVTIERILAASPATTRGQPTQLSVDAKGERLAYASGKSVFVRSIDNPADSSQYTGHTAATTVARFSPSGFKIASGDASGMVRVWEPTAIENTRGEYGVFSGRVNDIAWDGESQRIIAVGDGQERFGKAITADSGNSVGEIIGHSKVINAVAMRAQRPFRAATVSDDGSMCFLHGVPFAFKKKEANLHTGFVFGAAYSPDGSRLVTVGADKRIQLYDGREGTPLEQVGEGEHTGSIFGVGWDRTGRKIATASADRTVKLWDVEAGKVVQSWRFGGEGGVSVPDQQVGVVVPHGRSDGLIVSVNLAGDLIYLNEGTPEPTRIVQGHNKGITALGGASDGQGSTLFTGSFDGRVCQWSVGSGIGTVVDGAAHTNQVAEFASAEGTTYSVAWDDKLRLVDEGAKTFLGAAVDLPAQPQGVAAANGCVYVATSSGIAVYSGDKLLSETKLTFAPTAIAAHGRTVAAGVGEKSIRIYTDHGRGSLEQVAMKSNPTGDISALAFSRDGKHLAAGNAVGKIYVYGSEGWAVVADRWSAHTARVTCIAWNDEGTHAASGSLDTNVHIWCLEKAKQGKRIKAANAHKDGVSGVGWVEGGRVVSVGGDAAVKVWKVENLP